MSISFTRFRGVLALGAILSAILATPAVAGTRTRLVDCATGSCLLVTGRRASESSAVTINGHAVAARGARKWRVSLPIETIRQWSVPYARTIMVSVDDNDVHAPLPIGLLGHVDNLAFLTVRAK